MLEQELRDEVVLLGVRRHAATLARFGAAKLTTNIRRLVQRAAKPQSLVSDGGSLNSTRAARRLTPPTARPKTPPWSSGDCDRYEVMPGTEVPYESSIMSVRLRVRSFMYGQESSIRVPGFRSCSSTSK